MSMEELQWEEDEYGVILFRNEKERRSFVRLVATYGGDVSFMCRKLGLEFEEFMVRYGTVVEDAKQSVLMGAVRTLVSGAVKGDVKAAAFIAARMGYDPNAIKASHGMNSRVGPTIEGRATEKLAMGRRTPMIREKVLKNGAKKDD